MRLTIIFFLIFHSTILKVAEGSLAEMKGKIISLYDAGKPGEAVSRLQALAVRSKTDAFFAWLNIAVIESERNNREQAEKFLAKAILINPDAKLYLSMCRKIVSGESAKHNKQFIVRFEAASDPLEKLLLWQFLYYPLGKVTLTELDDFKKVLDIVRKDLRKSTLRYAKTLAAESFLFYMNDDEEMRVTKLIESNRMLDSLGYSASSLFIRNVRKLFYYSVSRESKKYSYYFLKYENDPFLMKNKEIQIAVNYYKSRYFFFYNDLQQSLFFCRKAYTIDPEDQNVINFMAYIHRHLKEYKQAIHYYTRLKGPLFSFESHLGTLRCAFESGDTVLGKKMADRLVREASPGNTGLYDLSRIANNLYYTGQFNYFFKLDKRVMDKYVRENPKNVNLGAIFNFIAVYYWHKGKFRESLAEFQKALLAVLPFENRTDPFVNLNVNQCLSYSSLIDYLNNKGEAFYQLSKQQKDKHEQIRYLVECYKNLSLSIDQMYKYKLQLSSDEQMYLYSVLQSRRYPNIIKVCLELYNLTGDIRYHYKAFEFAEQGRAAIMLSTFRGNNAWKIGVLPEKYKALEDSVNLLAAMINGKIKALSEDNPEVYPLRARLDILAVKRSALEKLFKAQYPDYYRLKYSTEVTNVHKIQQQLGDQECLIEYMLNNNFLISFYIDKRNLLINTDTLKNTNLSRLAASFYHHTSQFSLDNYRLEMVKAFAADAELLYSILLKPFEDKFRNKNIIIVADNDLQKISFESLLTGPTPDLTGYKNLPYLLKKNTVIYTPSATILNELRTRPQVHRRARLLAIDPVYPELKNRDSIHNILLSVRMDTAFMKSLPYAREEVSFAHSLAGGKLLSGERASETRFKRMADKFDIIHLATHGIINEDSVFDSKMVFGGHDSENDGFLYNYEVYNLKHAAQLVILSACNTGNGKNYVGEGVISIGRGFLSSGSRSVLMTMWQVNDHTSSELMKGFYIHLKGKLKVSEALRKSKLDFLGRTDNLHSHPFFWSGYIGYGDASISLKIGNYIRVYWWGAALIMVILTGGYFIFRQLSPLSPETEKDWSFRSCLSADRRSDESK